jgi:hypothetical protein
MSNHEQEGPLELGDEQMSVDAWADPPEDEGWLDDHDLPLVVDDLHPGETIKQRNARLLEQQVRERGEDRSESTSYDPPPDPIVAELLRPRERYTDVIRGSAVKVIDADGNETWRDIGNDDEALRQFIEAHARESGYSLDELRRRIPPGRPNARDRRRRVVLAEIVAAAKKAGAKNPAIERALGVSRQRISDLIGSR